MCMQRNTVNIMVLDENIEKHKHNIYLWLLKREIKLLAKHPVKHSPSQIPTFVSTNNAEQMHLKDTDN